jgi:DNA-binding transcriptional regulator/RsmH inhibitor MraZ
MALWDISIDAYGRIRLDNFFRQLYDEAVLVNYLWRQKHPFLHGFSPAAWRKDAGDMKREAPPGLTLFPHVVKVRSEGRIVVPRPLREFAGLKPKRGVVLLTLHSTAHDRFYV